MFEGFSRETVWFLSDLDRNNNKEWFEAHRQDYEILIVEPALDLIETMAPVAERLTPQHKATPKINQSLRRNHRDTRFSKDKTPYNPRIHMVFWTGDHPNRSAGIHLVLAKDHFGFGSGHWAFDPEGLEKYRRSVLDDAARSELDTALESASDIGCLLGEEELKRLPKGYDADGRAAQLLRRKGLVAKTSDNIGFDDRIFGPQAVDFVTEIFEALAPLDAWIDRHVT
ncbi:MAG: TIGR02453 family protein [Rhizobiaceae bacterium MnEN-MB40S]|nr:MAG: TIGR02453 family protein [Rhizobiaceae bacterium MnEN-MB40S]